MATTRTDVANAISTYIKPRMLNPVAYNVPMHETAQAWPIPAAGDVLRVPRQDEAAEATSLSKDTIYDLTNTTGENDVTVPYDEYTIVEYGLFTNVNKWAKFTTALDIARIVGNRLVNSAARTMNSLSYDALVGSTGLQHLRVDGLTETAVEAASSINSATGISTTSFRTPLTQIDDWWNNGRLTFYTGANRGITRGVTDFANANGVVTVDAFPNTPANGDKFFIFVLGNDTTSGPSDLAATDTITLPALYRARERCLRFGAGGMGMDSEQLDVTGVMKKKDGMLKQGLCFMPTKMVYELQNTLAGNTSAQDMAYWQTSEGTKRALGGVILNVGGLMIIPVNHYKQMAVTDGALAVDSGVGHPTIILFPNAFGCTTLKDKPGNRQGMDITVKAPEKKDPAFMFDSLRYRGELDLINKYFCANALHGAVVWSGSSLV